MLKPLHDYVVLEKCKEEVKTKSGIILTTGEAKDAPSMGVVVAVGPGKMEDGKLVPIGLEKDEKVIGIIISSSNGSRFCSLFFKKGWRRHNKGGFVCQR